MIVGGGSNGVEISGIIAESFPEKKVGLVTKSGRLLSNLPPRASTIAEGKLKEMNVNIYYHTECIEGKEKELKYEKVINCTGFTYKYTSSFMKGDLSECLD